MPAAAPLPISPDDLAELGRWARSSHLPAVLAQRARILLLAADGASNTEIPNGSGCRGRRSSPVGAGMPTVAWRDYPTGPVPVGRRPCGGSGAPRAAEPVSFEMTISEALSKRDE